MKPRKSLVKPVIQWKPEIIAGRTTEQHIIIAGFLPRHWGSQVIFLDGTTEQHVIIIITVQLLQPGKSLRDLAKHQQQSVLKF